MKKIDNYSYDFNERGDLTIYTEKNGRTYSIATLEECLNMDGDGDLNKDAICEMIEECVLPDLDYELVEEK